MQTEHYIRNYDTNASSVSLAAPREHIRPEFKKIMLKGKLQDVCYYNDPSDKLNRFCEVVHDGTKRRFPKEWLAYTNGDVAPVNGTPIEQMPGIGERLALQMKATGLASIEDLANLTDSGCAGYMGGLKLREKAKLYLAGKAPDKTAELQMMVETQAKQIADLMAMLKPAVAPESGEVKRGPGRPPKDAA